MQQLARAVNDSIYIGIAKVYEALVIGTAASIWGDIPYREAADSTIEVPAFDGQLQVYADTPAELDSAVLFLAATPGAPNVGPPADNAELIYLDRGGNTAALAAVYTQVAHSLKARYYMHLAEVDPANYALALAEVPLGISAPANDMLWFHDQTPTGQNVWWQFMEPGRHRPGCRAGRDPQAAYCGGNRERGAAAGRPIRANRHGGDGLLRLPSGGLDQSRCRPRGLHRRDGVPGIGPRGILDLQLHR